MVPLYRMTTKTVQINLRLPEELLVGLNRFVSPRRRTAFFQALVRREIELREQERERTLTEAALFVNELEASDPALREESAHFVNAELAEPLEPFDRAVFEASGGARAA